MRKVVKLTESDLTRIVKKVIKEQKQTKQDVLKKQVLKNGWESVSEMIGFDNLYKFGFNNDYNEFLNLFNNLVIEHKDDDFSWVVYRGYGGGWLMMLHKRDKEIFINSNIIWSFLERLGFGKIKIKKIIKKWLSEVYGLTEINPISWQDNNKY
jgi:hypothetical protein